MPSSGPPWLLAVLRAAGCQPPELKRLWVGDPCVADAERYRAPSLKRPFFKSISAALTLAGFDSVKPTALEMFRSHAEECEYMPRPNAYM